MAPRVLAGQLLRRLEHVEDGMDEPLLLLAIAVVYLSILAISALAPPAAADLEKVVPYGIVGNAGEGYLHKH